jgi:Zn-dependent metalloprotease
LLKAPGKAYEGDPLLGKDQQPDHYSKLVKLPNSVESDSGGVHANSGIPNRAFYETAIRIGTNKAGKIWIESLEHFSEDIDLPKASRLIYQAAVRLYGEGSSEAEGVKAGWNAVGLDV